MRGQSARHAPRRTHGRLRVAASLTFALGAAHGKAEDLIDVLHEAILNDPTLVTADATRRAVAEGVPQARAALLPTVTGGLRLNQIHSGDSTTSTDSNGNLVAIDGGHTRERELTGELDQPLLNLADVAALRAAKASRDAQEQTYRSALLDLYARVASAYLNVLMAQDSVDVYQSYEDGYARQFRQASDLHKAGLVTATDMAQAQAYYLYIHTQRISAQDTLADDLKALEQITGRPVGRLKKLRKDIPLDPPVPADPKAWIQLATQNNPGVLAAGHAVDAAEHAIHQEQAGHLPTLNATVTYDKAGVWSSVARGSGRYGPGTTTIGLSLAVPIFSGGLTQSQVRQAMAVRDEDLGTLEGQRRQAARDAANYYKLVVDGIEQVRTAKASVDAAQKALSLMLDGYQIGTQSMTGVVNAIEVLAETQSQYSSVRHQLVLDRLLLKQATGTLDVKDLEATNRLLE